jgi:hypothetical protein
MVRWNAGTEHVKNQRQTLGPAGPKIEISERVHPWNPFIRQKNCNFRDCLSGIERYGC